MNEDKGFGYKGFLEILLVKNSYSLRTTRLRYG